MLVLGIIIGVIICGLVFKAESNQSENYQEFEPPTTTTTLVETTTMFGCTTTDSSQLLF